MFQKYIANTVQSAKFVNMKKIHNNPGDLQKEHQFNYIIFRFCTTTTAVTYFLNILWTVKYNFGCGFQIFLFSIKHFCIVHLIKNSTSNENAHTYQQLRC